MDFGSFTESPSQPLAVGASQQAQVAQSPARQSSSYPYPQEPSALLVSSQVASVLPVSPQPRSRRSSILIITLVAVLVVCIIIGSGIIYYAAIAQPAALHTQATTTAKAYATTQAQASATAYANTPQGILALATSGTPTITDSLSNPDNSIWANHSNTGGQCAFTNGQYHITVKVPNYYYYCTPITTGFTNFAFQVQMTLLRGDSAGIMFRVSGPGLKSYIFSLNSQGFYVLTMVSSFTSFKTLALNRSSAIKQGYNQPNLLTVVARNSDIYLFVNKQYVTKVSDSTYSEGNLGLLADAFRNAPTEAAFSNVEAWDLP